MARHNAKTKTEATGEPPATAGTATAATATSTAASKVPDTVGPPLLLLAAGFVSVVLSAPLVVAEGIAAHVVGYVFGSLVPILLVGLVRRADLDRRRSPSYQERSFVRPALAILAVIALVAAGLHIWPIATELSK